MQLNKKYQQSRLCDEIDVNMDMESDDAMDTKRLEAYGRATDHQKNLKNSKNQKKHVVVECTKISRKFYRMKLNFDCR